MRYKCNADERAQSKKWLRDRLPPGSTVYCVLRHKSSSGMSRSISLFIVHDGALVMIDRYAAEVMSALTDDKYNGIKVSGAGMDMGWHLVYTLSRYLYDEGFTDEYIGEFQPDGGYALTQRWL